MSTDGGGPGRSRPFQRFAAALLVYLLLVILFGAWVRVTGSGAGCGEHWPTCHGEIMPRAPNAATVIEFTHRISSGLLGLLCLALPIWARWIFRPGHMARWASLATLVFVAIEAAIGARLVLAGLVASNASVARAVAVALHLVNTLLLTASAALTIAAAGQPAAGASPRSIETDGQRDFALLAIALCSLVLVAATGAVTALGDTLFPVGSSQGVAPSQEHFLVQLRIVHPVLAAAVGLFVLALARRFSAAAATRVWSRALGACTGLQLFVGGLDIVLRAPGWLQLVHLLFAQLLWISAVMLAYARACSRLGPTTAT